MQNFLKFLFFFTASRKLCDSSTMRNVFSVVFIVAAALSPMLTSTALADDLPVSPGDTLQVYIPGAQQPDQTYLVDIQGNIDLGVYGRLKIGGKPLKKAESLLKQHLSKYLKSTDGISLFLKQQGRIVLITGCVEEPGVVSIQSTDDLWQAIHRAGGLSDCADLTRVTFYRNGVKLDVDLRSYLTGETQNPPP